MKYISTRGSSREYTPSAAVIAGLADDGGLFVPTKLPKLDVSVADLVGKDYRTIAYEVMKLFFTDYTKEELTDCIAKAYDSKFDTDLIAPLCEKGGQYFLELFHGPTIAFKDMALSILPHLLTCALRKNSIDDEVVIMTATSGDTGKAALAAFDSVPNTRIIVFYPKGGVSPIQERQMVTQKGANTKVVGVRGNFDDCQSKVKEMFSDPHLAEELSSKGFRFSSANSINIGRLIPQVVYYVYAYVRMVESGAIENGAKLNFTVPTGNFGNILAAFYAKNMGVPIGRLVCASNDNKVLYDFFRTGIYDRRREFILTTSPSMDILISSNLERLIYHSLGDDATVNASYMKQLLTEGYYEVGSSSKEYMKDFVGIFANESQVKETIKYYYDLCGYVIDTHTAVAAYANLENMKNDSTRSVVISTASPYKFTKYVLDAIDPKLVSSDDLQMADTLCSVSHVPVPKAVSVLKDAPIVHDKVCSIDEMKDAVREFVLG